ncbi:MAG: peptidase S41 [Candidatus Moraniibacteriota bacterium]|nr:MAG: peptidase S41 [Candidatus Moranbacteria bacterium]
MDHKNATINTDTTQNSIKSKKGTSRVLVFFSALFFSALFFAIGFNMGKDQVKKDVPFDLAIVENKEGENVDFGLFWDVWDLVKEKYVDHDNLKAEDMIHGAINGMLSATGDPYTNFLDPEQFAELSEELRGSFEGIGAEVGMKDGIVTIVAPLEDSPAEKAGLRAGDKVVEIEGESTSDMTIDDAVKRMRGEKGTELHLRIFRLKDETTDTQDITVIRDVIRLDSVKTEFLDGGIAHVKIMQFGDNTIREFNQAVVDIRKNQVKGMIVDLRNNPGGILNTAVVLSSKFLSNDVVVVIEEDAKDHRKNHYTTGKHPFVHMPIVILINEGSASASEILAGALRDNREDVKIVGEQSFGKGSVQELIPTSATTAAKITVAKWLTPNGEQINDHGITPDEVVEYTSEDYENDRDPQRDRAIEIITESIKEKEKEMDN